MGILERVNQRALALKASPAPRLGRARAVSTPMDRWDMPDPANIEKQARIYAALSWVQIAISHVAQGVAKTPFKVYQSGGRELSVIPNHPFLDLLKNPNPLQSRYELWSATVSWKKAAGNCYWWLNKKAEDAPPDEIWIIPAQDMQPVPDGNMGIQGYLYDDGSGTRYALEPWQVCHFKTWNPFNKYVGLSAIQSLMLDAMGDLGAQEFNARFYDKGTIKGRGILAFADAIDDGKWGRLREDWKEQHGGRNNNPVVFLRSVGAGGVQWLPTQLSQAETKYLEVREFTKAEVFALLAPGLSSILDKNATESNATTGKDTFLELAVAPELSVIDEKVSQVILPSYGDGLVGQFDSVERVDTQIELEEQDRYERTHTVDEVRKKYYQDAPIGDERGKLLPAEVGKGLTDARKPEDKPPPPVINNTPPVDPTATGKAEDLRRWKTVALKALAAGKAPGSRPFDPDFLSDGEAMRVRAGLLHATTEEQVKAVFE